MSFTLKVLNNLYSNDCQIYCYSLAISHECQIHMSIYLTNYSDSSFGNVLSSVQLLSHVRFFATPWIAAHQASLSITNSRSSLKLMSIESVMPSIHLILCRPLFLLPPIPGSGFWRSWKTTGPQGIMASLCGIFFFCSKKVPYCSKSTIWEEAEILQSIPHTSIGAIFWTCRSDHITLLLKPFHDSLFSWSINLELLRNSLVV